MKGEFSMPKKMTALVLAAALLLALAMPSALASEYYSARTPLYGSGRAKINNIDLAVEAINGTVVPYGGSFSFNETVGPRTKSRGFQKAPNGRGAQVTGGGVAQVATTLYMALRQVRGELYIDPVKTYGSRFTDNYVSDPDLAVITDYDADIDLSFTNYEDELTIDMWANDSYVYCSITVGQDEGGFYPNEYGYSGSDSTDGSQGGYDYGNGYSDSNGSSGWFDDNSSGEVRAPLCTSCLYCGDEANVLHNVELAAGSVNDTSLNSRDIFSFNDTVGPRTKKYGYRRATNGRGAQVTGGGVAQVASALWLAIKDSDDFSIVEKSTYGNRYNQDYVDSSADAILTDYSAGRDFSFRYIGDGRATIYTYLADDWLYCDIYVD